MKFWASHFRIAQEQDHSVKIVVTSFKLDVSNLQNTSKLTRGIACFLMDMQDFTRPYESLWRFFKKHYYIPKYCVIITRIDGKSGLNTD